jgi:heme exporter protein C
MAGWSAAALSFNTRLSAMMAQAIAPTGAVMTHCTVDGRVLGPSAPENLLGLGWMTSELILHYLYLRHRAAQCHRRSRRADRACNVLALTGVVNVPIIYFSVYWWNTLHQVVGQPHERPRWRRSCDGMLIMSFAAWCCIAVSLAACASSCSCERSAGWVATLRRFETHERRRASQGANRSLSEDGA